jgi:hypothetical protein
MEERSRVLPYILLLLCLVVIALYLAPLAAVYLQPEKGFTVIFVNETQAGTGEIVHVSDADIDMAPRLRQAVLEKSPGVVSLNQDQYTFYATQYPNYSRNMTGSRAYYEYHGMYFYLEFVRGDVNHP